MSFSTSVPLEFSRLSYDLQQISEITQGISGELEPEAIARKVTEDLIERFNCVFSRIWLVEPDRASLRLVASSGLHTRINGTFARVPMGAFKVGKIAQNGVSFLSNTLADEPWVRDRDWVIANGIKSFAGYPLMAKGSIIGVLATFSREPMAPEFLEALSCLCSCISVALEMARRYQQDRQSWRTSTASTGVNPPLSEQLVEILGSTRLMLVGTERPLPSSLMQTVLRAAGIFNTRECAYCRLSYGETSVALDAWISNSLTHPATQSWDSLNTLTEAITYLNGQLTHESDPTHRVIRLQLTLPYPPKTDQNLWIHCHQPLLQIAFSHLAQLAGLNTTSRDADTPLLTDDYALAQQRDRVLWVGGEGQRVPDTVKGYLELSTSPAQLREAVDQIVQGHTWCLDGSPPEIHCSLSERELEIVHLLAQGYRDRDIATHLYISESTVKFHLNNVVKKLDAHTRIHAVHVATKRGWLP